jgi:serine/threonine-protein kinase RsbW
MTEYGKNPGEFSEHQALAEPQVLEYELPSDTNEIDRVQKDFVNALTRLGWEEETGPHLLDLALRESIINAIKYGNQSDKTKPVKVRISVSQTNITVSIIDTGPGFDLENVPSPIEEEGILRTSGRGVFLMQQTFDTVDSVRHEDGFEIRMSKTRPAAQ